MKNTWKVMLNIINIKTFMIICRAQAGVPSHIQICCVVRNGIVFQAVSYLIEYSVSRGINQITSGTDTSLPLFNILTLMLHPLKPHWNM